MVMGADAEKPLQIGHGAMMFLVLVLMSIRGRMIFAAQKRKCRLSMLTFGILVSWLVRVSCLIPLSEIHP